VRDGVLWVLSHERAREGRQGGTGQGGGDGAATQVRQEYVVSLYTAGPSLVRESWTLFGVVAVGSCRERQPPRRKSILSERRPTGEAKGGNAAPTDRVSPHLLTGN
jgi:hypothetical protein